MSNCIIIILYALGSSDRVTAFLLASGPIQTALLLANVVVIALL